jgi:hypothetical protein
MPVHLAEHAHLVLLGHPELWTSTAPSSGVVVADFAPRGPTGSPSGATPWSGTTPRARTAPAGCPAAVLAQISARRSQTGGR